jgi:isocitrate dehydrogenase (NAD+)
MTRHEVTFLDGDGIGPEIAQATRDCIDATGAEIRWHVCQAGIDVYEAEGDPLPPKVIDQIKRTKVAIKAPITTPVGTGFRSVNVRLRKELDLYACLRPCKSYAGVNSRYDDIDIVIVRENTEDLYAGIEFEMGEAKTAGLIDYLNGISGKPIPPDSGISIKPISVARSERIVRFAFDYAAENGREKVTAVHKANIMKYSDGLFLSVARRVAEDYPEIEFEDRIVDNMCMQLVQKPELYDVMVLPNLYGDIVSDLCAGLVGGLGVAPGGNIGAGMAVFEATHGSAPKYAGKNVANPTALILSGVMMLRYLGEREAADALEGAVAAVIREGKDVTFDLKKDRTDPTAVGTTEMARAIIRAME